MINISSKHNCCGCEACVQVCPKHCISFDEDTEGFRYPSVNKTVCVDCGLCEKVCPILNQAGDRKSLNVYAAKNRNEQDLLNSSSGGIFILLANAVIRQGGVVFGAKFDVDWSVAHAYAETEEDVKAFMGSKYVQSRIRNTYKEAKAFLDAGRQVLFTGTSCHIAGLKCFLRKEYENLLTVDVICHGVPSPKVWRMYLDEVKQNASQGENTVSPIPMRNIAKGFTMPRCKTISEISFRDKRLGWKKFSFALTLTEASADGKQNSVSLSSIYSENPFMKVFLQNIILRPSCYSCPAKGGKSMSDITIADFWGIENVLPSFDDQRGVGLLMINTIRGNNIVDSLNLESVSVSLEKAVKGNPSYFKPVLRNQNRDKFFRKLNGAKSVILLMEHVTQPSIRARILSFLLRMEYKLKKCERMIRC